MASPQPTPFVRFSKELFEAFYQNPPATVAACKLWLWVLRWTWADFGKDETPEKTLREISQEVSISRASACRELQSLVRCRRLKIGAKGGYAIQKDYDLWREDTKKRSMHFGNTAKQVPLFVSSYVPNGETASFHRASTKRFTVGQSTVSPCETPIRSKNTVKNGEATDPQLLPNRKTDTPRHRAEFGHEEYAPEDHGDFKRLSFKLQDELTETWKTERANARKETDCRNGCGRPRASSSWPYCRSCTSCSSCNAEADGKNKFIIKRGVILCSACSD